MHDSEVIRRTVLVETAFGFRRIWFYSFPFLSFPFRRERSSSIRRVFVEPSWSTRREFVECSCIGRRQFDDAWRNVLGIHFGESRKIAGCWAVYFLMLPEIGNRQIFSVGDLLHDLQFLDRQLSYESSNVDVIAGEYLHF